MSSIGFQQTGHEKYAGPGHWNDTDMLVVGMVGWGRGEAPRPTHLTRDEQITHISLWALQAAPMLIGADLSQADAFTIDLLGNREVLAVNQDALGKAAGRISSERWPGSVFENAGQAVAHSLQPVQSSGETAIASCFPGRSLPRHGLLLKPSGA